MICEVRPLFIGLRDGDEIDDEWGGARLSFPFERHLAFLRRKDICCAKRYSQTAPLPLIAPFYRYSPCRLSITARFLRNYHADNGLFVYISLFVAC